MTPSLNLRVAKASLADVSIIVQLLSDMQQEINEFDFNLETFTRSIAQSLSEQVHWFIFYDQDDVPCGTCYMQSVHNYWRLGKRYYLGGFYIAPAYRGKGHFRKVYAQLKTWAENNDGVQIYVHIYNENAKSINTFSAVGLEKIEYSLYVDRWPT